MGFGDFDLESYDYGDSIDDILRNRRSLLSDMGDPSNPHSSFWRRAFERNSGEFFQRFPVYRGSLFYGQDIGTVRDPHANNIDQLYVDSYLSMVEVHHPFSDRNGASFHGIRTGGVRDYKTF